ncbi:hypothetical protein O6H91_19G001600 [Diphasiastrum complanatum]|uniref:Uncharacterized protein n=1 Tax=Diphasiastrum complanatum TaxID=34168 RepID=A0ACC2AS29_DIPCM|nr:hypothetical protein O6H91_19G001600 [Diphasiastrum complanatum]
MDKDPNVFMALAVAVLVCVIYTSHAAGILSPSSLPPQSGLQPPTVCNGIDCQKGTCVPTSNPLFPFECQCQKGWRNFLNETFMGCGIPDCQFNVSSCAGRSLAPIFAPAPAPAPSPPTLNFSNVCSFPVCGKGDCVLANASTSLLPSYTCRCHNGSGNIFNSPSSLCVSKCNIGADCKSLGIVSPFPPPPPPPLPGTTSICSGIDCQMGNCVPNPQQLLAPYQCQCDDGWKNLLNLTYLPCGLPDCDFQINCPNSGLVRSPPASKTFGMAPAPSPLSSSTLLNICSTSVCGDGDCILTNSKILLPSYTCKCHQGAYSLFNSSSAMCVASCNLGFNCAQIPGLNSPKNSSSTNAATGREDCMISSSLLVAAAAATLWLAM